MVARQPRFAGVRSDYDRVLKQRNTLLKTAGGRGSGRRNEGALSTLDTWDAHLCRAGSELLAARLSLVDELRPHVARHYADVAMSVPKAEGGNDAALSYKPSLELEPDVIGREQLAAALQRRSYAAATKSSTAASRWSVRTATT